MSTPTSLDLPVGVRRTTIRTSRGSFAALEAIPASGVCEREAALLVPGYTGSKEDFLSILDMLADGSRHVVAADMRGQFETSGAGDAGGYSAAALGADILAIMRATGTRHLVGHSYGGLIAREAVLARGDDPPQTPPDPGGTNPPRPPSGGTNPPRPPSGGTNPPRPPSGGPSGPPGRRTPAVAPDPPYPFATSAPPTGAGVASLTLMSSGPGRLTGPRAEELRGMLAVLGVTDADTPPVAALQAGIFELWRGHLEPQFVTAGVPGHIVAFLARRMFGNDPNGLVMMARHLLGAPDRTAELARLRHIPMLVIYGENDDAWSPAVQESMARRLDARRLCIPAAVHSPAVEAPATTAIALTRFWDAAERAPARAPAAAGPDWTPVR